MLCMVSYSCATEVFGDSTLAAVLLKGGEGISGLFSLDSGPYGSESFSGVLYRPANGK